MKRKDHLKMRARLTLVWILVSLLVEGEATYQTYDRRGLSGYGSYNPSYSYSGYGNSFSSRYRTGSTQNSNGYRSPEPSYTPKKLPSSYGSSIFRSGQTSLSYEPEHIYKPIFVYKSPSSNHQRDPKTRYEPKMTYGPKSTSYGYDPKPNYGYDRSYEKQRQYDPCEGRQEGDYVMDGDFRRAFPDASPECSFIKCANYKAYINPCSYGTKNDKYGKGFCSYLDYHHECGHPPPKKTDYRQK